MGEHQPFKRAQPSATAGAVMCAVVCAVALALTASATVADAQAPVTLDPAGASVAAYGGWSAWSRAESTGGQQALVIRSPEGAISLAPVSESSAPFDVELGPSGSHVAAVYSRCTSPATRQGCHIFLLELGVSGASERALTPPGGGSDHEPAIWQSRLVFLRRDASDGSEDPTHPGRRPDGLYSWSIGSRKLGSLTLPSSRGAREAAAGEWPAGLTGLITGLTFNGQQVGYVTGNVLGSFGESTLWFQPLGGRAELIDQVTGGAGNVCQPAFISPLLSGKWLYAYLHACDPSADPHLDRLTRYRHGQVQRARFTFLHSGDETITSVVPDGAGVDWDANGVERLASVAWQTITAPVAETFCSRSDPFC